MNIKRAACLALGLRRRSGRSSLNRRGDDVSRWCSFRPRALAGLFALGLLVAWVIGLHELDQRHLGSVALTGRTKFVDPSVTTRAIGELFVEFIEQLGDRGFVADDAQREAAKVNRILFFGLCRSLFGLGNDFLNERTESLRLGEGGLDPLVSDQRGGHIGHHRTTMFDGNPK